jgi:hypothetical protein
MPSVLVTSLNELCRNSILDDTERKEVYDAALRLAWSVESQQDTAQRLYHGVSTQSSLGPHEITHELRTALYQ